jgi:aminobenzoyl-glutamate utilization protein B
MKKEMDSTAALLSFVESRASEYDALARDIWEHPEVSHEELRSSALYRERLAGQGFRVQEFPEMPYSFCAEAGRRGPVIAFMGEYDALPGMSQTCAVRREPVEEGAPGHACGHNLLGMGSLVAAEALVHLLGRAGLEARVRFYGCPAEESLGRIPLVKAGRFDDVDAAMTWHPADVNTPHRYRTSANLSLIISYEGRASHAGMAPHAGRSALDAVQLFNLSVEFLREHVPPGTLFHYVITNGGAKANIVPEHAALHLYVRAPTAQGLRQTVLRVRKSIRGAELMTETKATVSIKAGKCDFIPNSAIQDTILEAMRALPLPTPTEEEIEFARGLQKTIAPADRQATLLPIGAPVELLRKPLHLEIGDFGEGKRIGGSLDTGDVSYVVPTGQMNAATWPLGVGAHTWQSCAASGGTWAVKAARYGGMSLALAGFLLVKEPERLVSAAREHKAVPAYRSTMDM